MQHLKQAAGVLSCSNQITLKSRTELLTTTSNLILEFPGLASSASGDVVVLDKDFPEVTCSNKKQYLQLPDSVTYHLSLTVDCRKTKTVSKSRVTVQAAESE